MAAPAKPVSAANLSGRRLGRYEVLTQLASGGMAAVYIARAQGVAGFERLVAVKVLHPHLAHEEEFITMFLDEARLAARIRHPNVVATLDISDTEGAGYFLVMDYIEGDHLGALLRSAAKERARLPVPAVSRIVLDALAGLGAAHSLVGERGEPINLVHRDVSPHNIMVGKDGVTRLTDFGVAKAEVRLSSTREGQFKGKLSYMAPEHASSGEADQRSDLFSMGIVLWECLTGRRLFRGENNAATLTKILNDPVPPVSEIDPELEPFDSVVQKALSRPPEGRFQSADDFIEALEEAARRFGGVGSSRQVAGVVKSLVGDKLKEEAGRIRTAVDDLGHSGIGEALLPLPVEGSDSHSSASLRPAIDLEAATQAARPTARSHAPSSAPEAVSEPRRGKPALWVLLLLLVVAGLVGAVLALSGPGGEEPLATEPDDPGSATAAAAGATEHTQSDPDTEALTEVEGEPGTEGGAATGGADPEVAPGGGDEPETTADGSDDARDRLAERRRLERLRRQRELRRQQASMETAMETTSGMATSMGSDDDDLLANPYRR